MKNKFKFFAPEDIQDRKSNYKNVIKKLTTEIHLGVFINPNIVTAIVTTF